MIHIIATSANFPENYDARKTAYLAGLSAVIEHYQINPYIIETHGTDYLGEHYVGATRYSNNKGVDEFTHIEHFLKTIDHKLNDDDDIIKITLRYKITSSVFLDHVKQQTHDIYCKYLTEIYGPNAGLGTFLVSMKYRCWKKFFTKYNRQVDKDYPIENEFTKYAMTENTKIVEKLGIIATPYYHQGTYAV
jgi:hypothetical protein